MTNAAMETQGRNSIGLMRRNGEHMYLQSEAKIQATEAHQREEGRKSGAVPHKPGVSTGLWRYRCDHVPNAVLTNREELPLRWKSQGGREGVRDSMKNSKEPFEY